MGTRYYTKAPKINFVSAQHQNRRGIRTNFREGDPRTWPLNEERRLRRANPYKTTEIITNMYSTDSVRYVVGVGYFKPTAPPILLVHLKIIYHLRPLYRARQ